MSSVASMTVDQSGFNAAFSKYIEVTHRTFSEAANKKAFYVARKCTWEGFTDKADIEDIRRTLGGTVSVSRVAKKSGRTYRKRSLQLASATKRKTDIPLASLIILKRRFKRGDGWADPRSSEVQNEVKKMIAARNKSVAYIKSGWVPAIRELAKYAKATGTPADSSAQQVGKPKGHAEPAINVSGDQHICKIINEAFATRDKKNAFYRVGSAGLMKALDDERKDMEREIAKAMQPAADEFNRLQGR
jgi:hypothetical protein